jgi:hypothetical protein
MNSGRHEITIRPPSRPLAQDIVDTLRDALNACPDVAFAHLVDVEVGAQGSGSEPTLFVWLVPDAVSSLRGALNLISETVARALPKDGYLDVLILNSVPELLEKVEAADCLLVERDPEERRRALKAAETAAADDDGGSDSRRWWWPF